MFSLFAEMYIQLFSLLWSNVSLSSFIYLICIAETLLDQKQTKIHFWVIFHFHCQVTTNFTFSLFKTKPKSCLCEFSFPLSSNHKFHIITVQAWNCSRIHAFTAVLDCSLVLWAKINLSMFLLNILSQKEERWLKHTKKMVMRSWEFSGDHIQVVC